jgi:hypothetical protein
VTGADRGDSSSELIFDVTNPMKVGRHRPSGAPTPPGLPSGRTRRRKTRQHGPSPFSIGQTPTASISSGFGRRKRPTAGPACRTDGQPSPDRGPRLTSQWVPPPTSFGSAEDLGSFGSPGAPCNASAAHEAGSERRTTRLAAPLWHSRRTAGGISWPPLSLRSRKPEEDGGFPFRKAISHPETGGDSSRTLEGNKAHGRIGRLDVGNGMQTLRTRWRSKALKLRFSAVRPAGPWQQGPLGGTAPVRTARYRALRCRVATTGIFRRRRVERGTPR